MPDSYVKRQIEPLLTKWLDKPEVIFLTGARQVGKTTLLRKTEKDLKGVGRRVVFANLEEPPFKQRVQKDPYRFLQELVTVQNYPLVVLLDEFQKVPEILEAIKVFYDQNPNQVKFVLSGSASIITRKRGEESLLGRSVRLNLYSFSWQEFNLAKNHPVSVNKSLRKLLLGEVKNYQSFPPGDQLFLEEYLLWGGFPRVVSEKDETSKLTLYENIKQAFLERDIQALIKEEQLPIFEQLMEMLAARCGQLVSFAGLASDLTVSPQTVRHLAFLLKHSYWLDFVYPLAGFGSGYKKSPKVYFHDLGFRHSLLRWLSLPSDPVQGGAIAENLVFNVLTRLLSYEPSFAGKLSFWRTYDGAEVDFVLDLGRRRIGLEVKYQTLKRPLLSRGSQNFIEKFKPDLFLVITRDGSYQFKHQETTVIFLPLIEFICLT